MKRRSAFQIIALLTLALAALTLLALACGPTAPAGQAEKPTPTPVAIPDDTRIGPMVQTLINQPAGASGGERSEEATVTVIIQRTSEGDAVVRAVYDFLIANGAVADESDGSLSTYQVPVSLLPRLIQHEQVSGVFIAPVDFPYPSMDRTLNNVVAVWQNGATPEQAAIQALVRYEETVMVIILSPNPASLSLLTAAKRLLDNNEVYVNPDEYELRNHSNFFTSLVPVPILPSLAQIEGLEFSTLEWGRTPSVTLTAEERRLVDIALEKLLPPPLRPTPTSNVTPRSGARGAPDTATPTPTIPVSEGVTKHGADAWHDDEHGNEVKGDGVKVGIVDWGFDGFPAPAYGSSPNRVPAITHGKQLPEINLGESGNAHCPLIGEDVPPAASFYMRNVHRPCHPRDLNHGTSVAEAVHDVAPEANLYMARATSLNELRDSVDWLIGKEVDVIVHAAGWPYDGSGDGASPFDGTLTPNQVSPLNTVEKAIRNNITWVNAAGNQALYTWTKTSANYTVNDGFHYDNYIVFSPGATDAGIKTCLQFTPHGEGNIYFYHIRWADDWPSSTNTGAKFDLDVEIHYGVSISIDHGTEKWGTSYPLDGFQDLVIEPKSASACLRVKVNPPSSQPNGKPAWVQVQIFTGKEPFDPGITSTPQGMSIVNPAESNNPGLIAVAAADLRNSAAVPPITNYSSRGPVLAVGTTGDFSRTKPDLAGGSHGVNWLKRDGETDDDRRFGGTSQAAGHMGGLAALVVQQLRLEREDDNYRPPPEMVADRLKSYGVYPSSTVARAIITPPAGIDTNQWGAGFVKLPSPTAVPVRPTGLSGGDHHRRVALQVWTDFDVDVAANTYTDTTVESGKTYIYRVAALKSNNKGSTSNGAEVTIP